MRLAESVFELQSGFVFFQVGERVLAGVGLGSGDAGLEVLAVRVVSHTVSNGDQTCAIQLKNATIDWLSQG
jgi:hypothetical protein